MLLCLLPPFLLVLLLGYTLHRALRVDAAFTPLLALACIMLCLAGFGGVNLLWPGRLLLCLGILAAAVFPFGKQKKPMAKRLAALVQYLLSPGVLAFIIGCVFLAVLFVARQYFYYEWDDYSHWGPFFKSVFQSDRLHLYTGLRFEHQTYPQATTVLYYFFTLFAPAFSEAHTLAVLGCLLTACAACLLAGAQWRTPVPTVLRMACVPLFFTLFPYADSYITAYHDTALGAVFGAVLLLVVYLQPRSLRHTAAAVLGMAALTQIKEIGALLALVCFALFALRALVGGRAKTLRANLRANWHAKTLLCVLAAGIATALPTVFWKLVLTVNGATQDQFADPLSHNFIARVSAALKGQDDIVSTIFERYTINFRTAPILFNGYGTPLFCALAFTALAVVFGVWLWRQGGQSRGNALVLWSMPLFFLAYLFAVFYTYVCMMSEREGVWNMSYQRYLSCFLIGWCMLALGSVLLLGNGFFKRLPHLLPALASGAVALLLLYGNIRHDRLNLHFTAAEAGRPNFDHVSAQMLDEMQPGEKVWLISQGDTGIYRYMFKYTLLPAEVSLAMPQTVGYGDGLDTPAEFLARAGENGIDYVLVYIPDEVFEEKFAAMFSDGLASVLDTALPSLYRIEYGEDTPFTLVTATSLA